MAAKTRKKKSQEREGRRDRVQMHKKMESLDSVANGLVKQDRSKNTCLADFIL